MQRSDAVRGSRGFTLVELLVVIAIIGILVAILLPAVQAAREAARRMDCSNRLKQLALALHNYETALKTFPPGYVANYDDTAANWCRNGPRNLGAPWTVLILPYMEQQSLHDQFNFNQNFTSTSHYPAQGSTTSQNHRVWETPLAAYQCPTDKNSRPEVNNINYFGVQGGGATSDAHCFHNSRTFFNTGVLFHNSRVRIADIRDGTTNTWLLGETRYVPTRPHRASQDAWGGWASSARLDGAPNPYTQASCVLGINSIPGSGGDRNTNIGFDLFFEMSKLFGSFHPGGCQFALADGSVRFVSQTIDLSVYRQAANRNDQLPHGIP